MREALIYVCTVVIMLALDAVFLGLVAVPQFRAALGDILLARPRLAPAILFYLLYAVGILAFATLPAPPAAWGTIAGRAALFGLIAYATYDLTNYATLQPWTLRLVIMDLIWGTIATTAAAVAGGYGGDSLTRLFRPS